MKNIRIIDRARHCPLPSDSLVFEGIDLKIWSEMTKYIEIKKDIINEANAWMKNELGNSKNGIGIFTRGTDRAVKPKGHYIKTTSELIMEDIDKMHKKYNFDWIYLMTEDKTILDKFINKYGKKLKYIKEDYVDYKEGLIGDIKGIIGTIEKNRNYIMKTYILFKCKNVLSSITSIIPLIYILSDGFKDMNAKVYNLGLPK